MRIQPPVKPPTLGWNSNPRHLWSLAHSSLHSARLYWCVESNWLAGVFSSGRHTTYGLEQLRAPGQRSSIPARQFAAMPMNSKSSTLLYTAVQSYSVVVVGAWVVVSSASSTVTAGEEAVMVTPWVICTAFSKAEVKVDSFSVMEVSISVAALGSTPDKV